MVRELSSNPALRGKVIPLAFHVDYWNHLGWRDPFSAAEWSRRQQVYAGALHLASAYTPQMVVNGKRQFVGSNGGALDRAVADASHDVSLGVVRLAVSRESGALKVAVTGNVTAGKPVDVLLAVFEDGISTKIAAGENSGMSIVDDAVVRRLVRVDTLSSGATEKVLSVPIEPAWNAAHLGVAVFLQDRKTLAIGGAALAR